MTDRYALTPIGNGVATLRIATDAAPHVQMEDLVVLRAAIAALDENDSIRAVVLEGGERHFCAGATRQLLLEADAAERITALVGEAARLLLSIPVPTVAAIAGHALGGGLMFGLWCDAAVLAEEGLYGVNFVDLGFTPGMGSTALLAEVVGPMLARELLLTGRVVTGAELRTLAPMLAHTIGPRAEVHARAVLLAEALARPPSAAVRATKALLARQRRAVLEAALADERVLHHQSFDRPDTRAHIAHNYAETS